MVCLVPKRLLLEMLGKEGALPPPATPCWSLSGSRAGHCLQGWGEAPRERWLGICAQIFFCKSKLCVISNPRRERGWILVCLYAVYCAKLLQSCPTLCNPKDHSPRGSSVPGILQTRILEWVAVLSSRGPSRPRDLTRISFISCIRRWVLYH